MFFTKKQCTYPALLLATLFWGITLPIAKPTVELLGAYHFLFWRFAVAAPVLFLIALPRLRSVNRKTLIQGLLLGIILAITALSEMMGLALTKATTASFLISLSLVFVTLIESARAREWPSMTMLLACLSATVGSALMTLHHNQLSFHPGDALLLFGAFTYAFYFMIAGHYTSPNNAINLTLIQCITLLVLLMVFAPHDVQLITPHSTHSWEILIFCGMFASVFAFLLQIGFQRNVSTFSASLIFTLCPVFSTLTAVVLLHEKMTMHFLGGAFLILMALMLTSHQKNRLMD